MKCFDWLKCPLGRGVENHDDREVTIAHARILREKPFLKKLYTDFYNRLKAAVPDSDKKTIVELGSGGGFIKDVISNAVTSDVLDVPNVDKVFSACLCGCLRDVRRPSSHHPAAGIFQRSLAMSQNQWENCNDRTRQYLMGKIYL
jgi:hypothetical protein